MRVTKITINNLFGMFDHVIPLNLKDRITIVYGENGIGKTALINIINTLLASYKKEKLERQQREEIPYDFIKIDLNNGECIEYPSPNPINSKIKAKIISIDRLTIKTKLPASLSPSVERKVFCTYDDVQENYKTENTVNTYSEDLVRQFNDHQREYDKFSRDFEREYLQKLKDLSKSNLDIDILKLQEMFQANRNKQLRYSKLGIDVIFEEMDDLEGLADSVILGYYLHAFEIQEKLKIFEPLADKIELFLDLVNKRFSYKTLQVDKSEGFKIINDKNVVILPEKLSSGEQHELIMFYDLIFKTEEDTLVMIDEPELSLHPVWQMDFIDDMSRIIELSKFDLLIATHSPSIINERWDLTVGLGGR